LERHSRVDVSSVMVEMNEAMANLKFRGGVSVTHLDQLQRTSGDGGGIPGRLVVPPDINFDAANVLSYLSDSERLHIRSTLLIFREIRIFPSSLYLSSHYTLVDDSYGGSRDVVNLFSCMPVFSVGTTLYSLSLDMDASVLNNRIMADGDVEWYDYNMHSRHRAPELLGHEFAVKTDHDRFMRLHMYGTLSPPDIVVSVFRAAYRLASDDDVRVRMLSDYKRNNGLEMSESVLLSVYPDKYAPKRARVREVWAEWTGARRLVIEHAMLTTSCNPDIRKWSLVQWDAFYSSWETAVPEQARRYASENRTYAPPAVLVALYADDMVDPVAYLHGLASAPLSFDGVLDLTYSDHNSIQRKQARIAFDYWLEVRRSVDSYIRRGGRPMSLEAAYVAVRGDNLKEYEFQIQLDDLEKDDELTRFIGQSATERHDQLIRTEHARIYSVARWSKRMRMLFQSNQLQVDYKPNAPYVDDTEEKALMARASALVASSGFKSTSYDIKKANARVESSHILANKHANQMRYALGATPLSNLISNRSKSSVLYPYILWVKPPPAVYDMFVSLHRKLGTSRIDRTDSAMLINELNKHISSPLLTHTGMSMWFYGYRAFLAKRADYPMLLAVDLFPHITTVTDKMVSSMALMIKDYTADSNLVDAVNRFLRSGDGGHAHSCPHDVYPPNVTCYQEVENKQRKSEPVDDNDEPADDKRPSKKRK
jgi:hypothetical protein